MMTGLMRPRPAAQFLLLLSVCACGAARRKPAAPAAPAAAKATGCVPVGQWVIPASGQRPDNAALIEAAAGGRIVLLGERHDSAADHRWQLQTIAALYGRRPSIAIGFEAFPRRDQPVLERWVKGDLDERQLLEESDWGRVWGLPAELYLPLFRFARMNRAPMFALSVDRSLVSRVAEEGWEQIPAEQREGVSDPAPAGPDYEKWLAETYRAHAEKQHADVNDEAALHRFIEAQLTWDRAFAEAIDREARARPDALVIGVMGSGHLQHRYGAPAQVAALGWKDVAVLLPWDESKDCEDLTPDLADAVFGVEREQEQAAPPPRLGVMIGPDENGVRIVEVTPDSVAAAAGLREDDVIVAAAGEALAEPGDLQRIVARQAPGTWLPLRVRRGKRTLEIVARFPSEE
jgi:uncharacterized iron-regulated protein